MPTDRVTIAPLVLLSVVDHYKRVSAPRVLGVLLGSTSGSMLNITNSFAIPFEESEERFFFDSSYLQNMFDLFYKVNCAEKIVGWYHSGPKMHKNDLEITKAFAKYCEEPLLAIVDVKMKASDIPVQIFQLKFTKELVHLDVQVGADETEEVGVEHLLRDIKEGTGCGLKDRVQEIKDSLVMYRESIDQIIGYLDRALNRGKRDYRLLKLFQEILNEIPRLTGEADMSRVFSMELMNTFVSVNDLCRNQTDFQKE